MNSVKDKETIRQSSVVGTLHSMYHLETHPNSPPLFKLKEQSHRQTDNEFNTEIRVSSLFAWAALFINCIFCAFVPCWLMGDLKSQSFTRNSWRYTTVSVLLIPFVMHEQRNIEEEDQKLLNVLTKKNLKVIFIRSINFCIWLLLLVNACRWTSMNHAVCLTGIKVVVVSLMKFRKKENFHEFEVGGVMLSFIGVILILTDSITLPQVFDHDSQAYLRVQPWKRLIFGDSLALIGSLVSYYLDEQHQVPKMPRFTYLICYNICLIFNLITFGFFFGGSQFSFNIKYGVLGLYTYENFVLVFYVSIMLGLTLMISNILVRQIFSELIINVSSCFEIIITSMIYHVLGLELVPSGMTCLGYSFLIPGMVFIIGGQGALSNMENKLNFELYKSQNEIGVNKISTLQLQAKKSSLCSPALQNSIKNRPFMAILQQEKNQNKVPS